MNTNKAIYIILAIIIIKIILHISYNIFHKAYIKHKLEVLHNILLKLSIETINLMNLDMYYSLDDFKRWAKIYMCDRCYTYISTKYNTRSEDKNIVNKYVYKLISDNNIESMIENKYNEYESK